MQNENAQNSYEEETGAKQGTDGEPEIERESSEIERRLLLQIYAQFLKKEYPGEAFATVREKSNSQRSRWIRAFFCSLFLICAAGIFLHKEAGEFLLFLHEQKNMRGTRDHLHMSLTAPYPGRRLRKGYGGSGGAEASAPG